MRIQKLKLNNIRSYTFQEMVFPEGSLLLSGDIGAGKSTILYAIEFALFGARRTELSGESLLRKGENSGSVELFFNINKKDIIIKRALKKTKNAIKQEAGYIVIDGVKQDATPIELKAKILELLGYPSELLTKSKSLIYRYTIYTPQEEMKKILEEDKDLRLDTLRKLFGMDKYKVIRDNVFVYLKELKDTRNRYEGEIEDLPVKVKLREDKSEDKKKTREKVEEIMPKIKDYEDKLDIKKKEYDETRKKIEEQREIRKEFDLSSVDIKNKTEQFVRLEKELDALNEEIRALISRKPENIENKLEINNIIEQKEKELYELTKRISEHNEKKKFLEERIKDTEQLIFDYDEKVKGFDGISEKINGFEEKIKEDSRLKEEYENNKKELDEINNKINEVEINKKNSVNIMEKIIRLSNCPTCMQDVSTEYKDSINLRESEKIENFEKNLVIINDKKIYLNELISKNNEKQKQIEEIKLELNKLVLNKQNIEEKKEIIEKQKKILVIHEQNYKELKPVDEEEINKIKNELKVNKDKLNKIIEIENLLKNIEDKEKRSKLLTESKVELNNILDELKIKNDTLRLKINEFPKLDDMQLQKHIDELFQHLNSLLLVKAENDARINEIDKYILDLDNEIKNKNETRDKIKQINEKYNWLTKYFMPLTENMEQHLMLRIYSEFNDLFKKWFNVLMDESATSARLDEDFTPIIEQNGYDVNIAHLSGGERTSAALAYRLALNKVVNDVQATILTKDIIILDEPTDGFSSEQLDRVREVLEQIGVKQIILVSHESKIESYVDNVIRVEKREHVSYVT